jgi:hypothetical protein
MTGSLLLDAFREQANSYKTKNERPSIAVSMHAIATQLDNLEIRCLISERESSPGEWLLRCSPEFDQTRVDARPDNLRVTLRANGTYVNDSAKVAVWISTEQFNGVVCDCDVRSEQPGSDANVTCNSVRNDDREPSFILSKISDDDISKLSVNGPLKTSDVARMYRLLTNDGNMCRVIDYLGNVTCVTDSNETVNDQYGVYFKVDVS